MELEKKEELKKKLLDIRSLKISRVDKRVYLQFTQMCKDKFCDDYGQGLAYLVRAVLDEDWKFKELNQKIENIKLAMEEKLTEFDERLVNLEGSGKKR